MIKRIPTLLFLLTITMVSAQDNQSLNEQLGTIQATTKVNNKIYTFYSNLVKIQNGTIQAEGEFKKPEELFLGAKPAGEHYNINAALYFGNGRVYLFEGTKALAFDIHPTEEGHFQYNEAESGNLNELFDLPPYWNHVDAAIQYDTYNILFFYGPGLLVYNLKEKRTGEEFPIFKSAYTKILGKVQLTAAFRDNNTHRVFIPKNRVTGIPSMGTK